ncbi:MAG: tRNA (N6-isopentenyl adenosine(37)-C2)-methylthiotransferase MiaB [Candidatus Moraniibacteriota bacterium]
MLYFIKTFGCQMNISDSERLSGLLEKNNYNLASKITEADLAIFNTCGIRQMAEDRAYGQIHNLKKKYPKIKIILTGCLANRKDVQKRLKKKIDFFCEIKDMKNILQTFDSDCDYLEIIPKYSHSHTAQVPIMTGCNNFCSYCVVPYARGREISRPAEDIISEIKNLIKNNCKEITLLGQNVNSYSYNKITFPELLKEIEKIPGHFWLRFMSSHPKDFSDELIEVITTSKKICEHIHLPIQAGSDKILFAMNRKYTAEHYLNLIKKLDLAFEKNKPNMLHSLSSDIIVGFPGETKKDFLESAEIMQKAQYDLVYFGQFSPRPGTDAWKLKDNILKSEKSRRAKYLNEILKKTALLNNQNYLEKTLEVLINQEKNGFYFGRTRTQKDVKIHLTPALSLARRGSDADLVGEFAKVKIIKANIWNLEACLPER